MRKLLVGLLLCLGCNPGGGSDGGLPIGFGAGSSSAGGPPGVSNPSGLVDEDAIVQYARQTCDAYERCGPRIYPERATCIEAMTCSLRSLLAGTTLTRGELLSCSHEVKHVACGAEPVLPNACLALVHALAASVGEEAGCGGELCTSGHYCDRSDEHCPRCVTYAELGEPCLNERCVRGTYCSTSTLNCEPEKTEGMPCGRLSECAQPRFGWDTWLTCRDGVCAKPVAVGGACSQPADCDLYLRCIDGLCTERLRVGEACGDRQDCYPYSACIRGVCTELCGFQHAGDPCHHDVFCRDSYCDAATSVCVATKSAGAACTRNAECGEGSFCATSTAACAGRLADGAPCALDDECLSKLCNGQVCEQPVCNG